MSTIQENIKNIKSQIAKFTTYAHRNPNSVTLLAVSKTKPVSDILSAYAEGQKLFGESYAQEACDKIDQIRDLGITDIEWHFIGPVQSNKTKIIAEHFDFVQSIDRIKIAQRLNDQRPKDKPPLKVLIQVNISNEPQKSGVTYAEIPKLISAITACSNLELRGFMGIAENTNDNTKIDHEFARLNNLFLELRQKNNLIDTLSLGMTADMSEAISCGSTMVRIGTAIFGAREYHQ